MTIPFTESQRNHRLYSYSPRKGELEKGDNKMTETQEVGGWDSYLNNFLKAANVKDETQEFVCFSLEESKNDGEKVLRLHVEALGEKFLFDLNKSNTALLKNSEGINHPKDVVGKKITFNKVMAMNPTLKKEVESLRIKEVK